MVRFALRVLSVATAVPGEKEQAAPRGKLLQENDTVWPAADATGAKAKL
jgi:hypothetical protein